MIVIIWSNLNKNWRRRSILKVVTSRVWRHRVTWRHRGGHHSVAPSLCYRLPIVTYPLAPLVSEIFDLKVADTTTDKTFTLTDNKGPLKLSAREPIVLQSVKKTRANGSIMGHSEIFPHTPKHGTDERFITLPIQCSMFIINWINYRLEQSLAV